VNNVAPPCMERDVNVVSRISLSKA